MNPSSVDLDRVGKLDPARAGAAPARPFAGWVTTLQRPGATWIMVPAAIVDSTLDEVAPRRAPDDAVICDGADSYGLYGRADRYLESFARDLKPRCTPYHLRRAKWLASSACAGRYFCNASAKQTVVAALRARAASGDGD